MEFDRFDILTRPRKTSKAQSEITKSKLQQDSRSALIANGQQQEKQSLHFNVSEAKNENQDKQNQQEQQHEHKSEHKENEKTDENQNQQSQKGSQKSKSFFGKIKQKWLQKDQKQKNPVNQLQNQQNESKNMQAQNDSNVIKEYEQLVINNNNKNKKYSEENQLEHRQSKVSENGSYLASGLREEQNSKTNLDNCSSFLDKMEKNFKSRRDKIKFQKFYDDLKNIIEDENNIEDISIQTMNQVNKLLLANPEFIEYFVDQCLNPVDSSDPIKKKGIF
ncbi:hypothetical protein PPERSA_06041 [Pseudocohnilembus persalinus]|uniref:Uncharacterized protein n=1 Tax=Pseudocohnilembus persalinus TaxID=266149 RepID=A0A0V0QR51_PSEPJ|nr:hypothetical protein PPERSA_06041 [Pseudocohnilembus persalinus]|eukprot:KRX04488.1 hypothetical protein PPERSA_06041 [Pseudocohnilembus persalinus]